MPIPGPDNQLYFATGIDNTGLMTGKTQAMGIIRGMSSQITKADVFAGLAIGATIAFAKVSKEMKTFSEEFEHSMREVQTISRSVQVDFEGFSQSIVDMSTDVPQTAKELSEAFYQIVSAGYDGAAGLELLNVSARAAVGGVTDVETAADGLTTVMNAWKISAENATKVSDIFFNTVRLGKTTMGELASNIAQVAPLAAAYGVGVEQIFSATASLTKQGTTTSMAMTQLRQALIAVNEELGQGWSETMTLQEAFVEISDRAKATGKDIKEFTGRVEGAMAILSMTGVNAKMAAEDLRSYGEAAGSSGKAFSIMMQDSINQSKLLKNNLQAALKPLGDFLAGKSTEFAKKLNEAFASGQMKEFAKYIAIATTALVAYKLVANGAALTTTMLNRATVAATWAMRGLNTAIKSNPIGVIAIGLTAAITALNAYKTATDKVGRVTGKLNETLGSDIFSLNSLFEALKTAKKGTEEWNTARETINTRYGAYLGNLIDEKTALEDIEKAQKNATQALIANAGIKVYREQLDQELNQFANKFDKTMGDFTEVFSEFKGADRLPEFIMAINEGIDKAIELGGGQIQRGMLEYSSIAKGIYDEFVYDISQTTGFIKWDPKKFTEGFLDLAEFKAKEADFTNYLQGMIAFFQEVATSFAVTPKEKVVDDPDKAITDLKNDLAEAKQAYSEWDEFKKTSRAKDLQGEYQQYLDLGNTYGEYLLNKLNAYKGNKSALALIIKQLAALEAAEIKALEKDAKDLEKIMLDAAEEITGAFADMMEQSINEANRQNTQALVDFNQDILDAQEEIARTASRFASNKEILDAQLMELDENYKNARLPKDEEYYRLRKAIINEYLGEEVRMHIQAATEIFNTLSLIAQDYNQELAEVFYQLEKVAASAQRAVDAFLDGDYLGAILNIFSALLNLQDVITPVSENIPYAESEEWRKTWEGINAELSVTNRLLQEQYDLLDDLSGDSWLNATAGVIEQTQQAMQGLLVQMAEFRIWVWQSGKPGMDPFGNPWGSFQSKPDWSMDDWQKYVNENPMASDAEEIQDMIDKYRAMEDQIENLLGNIDSKVTGTVSNTITNSIIEGFANGKTAVADFADTFEELMRNALLRGFSMKYVESQVQDWYDRFAKYSEDGLTEREVATLQAYWRQMIAQAQAGWENMNDNFNGFDFFNNAEQEDDPNSLAGSIRRDLSEDTGSLLAGRMNTMMLDLRTVAENMAEVSDTMTKIEYNTSFNRHLVDIRDDIQTIKNQMVT